MEGKFKPLAVLAICFTVTVWGLSYISTKVLLEYLDPVEIAFFRFFIAAVFLLVVCLIRKPITIEKKDSLRIAAGGVVGIPLYFLFENNGINLTTAGMASMIIAIIPVLNVITGAIFFKEKNTPRSWIGAALSFFGVYLIVSLGIGIPGGGEDSLRGNLLMLMAAFAWVAFTRINSPLLKKYDSTTINFYQILVGTIFLGFLALPGGVNVRAFSSIVIFNLVYLGILCSALAYFCYLYALKNLGSTSVTTFINLIPVFGVLGGVIILGETLLPGQVLGGLVVLFGVTLVTMPKESWEKVLLKRKFLKHRV